MRLTKLIQHQKHRKLASATGLLVVDAIFFSITDPTKVSVAGLMVGFLLVTATLYLLFNTIAGLAQLYGLKISGHQRFAITATGLCAGLFALQSINQLSLHDVLVIVPLAVIAYAYLSYGRRQSAAS